MLRREIAVGFKDVIGPMVGQPAEMKYVGEGALLRWRSLRRGELRVHPGKSDGSGEFAGGGCDAETAVSGFEPEFMVAAPQVLDEGMTSDDCPR